MIAAHLLDMRLLSGDIEAVIAAGIPLVFMPHGLGHNLGLETHDVGGLTEVAVRLKRLGLKARRNVWELKAGMVLTVECYFISSEIDKALADPVMVPFMDAEGLWGMYGFGGVA